MNDSALIEAYLAGDNDAFVELYNRHKGGIYRYLARQLSDPAVTDDLFQDIWSTAINKLATFNSDSKFTTWIYTIARHKLIDHVRHIKVVDKFVDADAQLESLDTNKISLNTPQGEHTIHVQQLAILHCLDKLPTHQKDCFLMREETGMTAQEISVVVDAGLEATKSRLRSAYTNLKKCLTNQQVLSEDIGNRA